MEYARVYEDTNLTAGNSVDDFTAALPSQQYLQKQKVSTLDFMTEEHSDIGTYLFGDRSNTLTSVMLEPSKDIESVQRDASIPDIVIKDTSGGRMDEEAILDKLCASQDGFTMLLARSKECMANARDTATFMRKRAQFEQEYGVMMKASLSIEKGLKENEARTKWLAMHLKMSEMRLTFGKSLGDISENITLLYKNTERSRKQLKESMAKNLKELSDVEHSLEKARAKFEFASEDWERSQTANRIGLRKSSSFSLGLTSSYQMLKQRLQHDLKLSPKTEEEARQRVTAANSAYKTWLQKANTARQMYHSTSLPRLIRALKETNTLCDEGVNKYMVKYAKCVEDLVMAEAITVSPLDTRNESGLLQIVEQLDSTKEFDLFVQDYDFGKEVDKKDHKYIAYMNDTKEAPAGPILATASFGGDLIALMERDKVPVPKIVLNCVEYIELSGMKQEGLYRVSGAGTLVNHLRATLDKDPDYPLEDVVQDIHTVTSLLKLFFRELEDSLFPKATFKSIIEISKMTDERLRLIKIHEHINSLHDANYATLKCMAGHLSRYTNFSRRVANSPASKMNAANLSIVWAPTFVDSINEPDASDLKYASRVIEIVIANYDNIFDE